MNAIEERILDCFPSGSYALSALLRLMDIVESDAVPTAAVECRVQPRLLVNPAFVARHAATPEHLLMLVMHELHHVLLGHTTLFPTVTAADNFVFDCVINALISRMFPRKEHFGFLTGYYSDRKFPECLLRPPANWNGKEITALPLAIRKLPEEPGSRVAHLYRELYSETGVSYDEIHALLPKLLSAADLAAVPLLGGHGKEGATAGGLDTRAPVLFEVVRGIVEEWPQPPDPVRGRSFGEVLRSAEEALHPLPGNRARLRSLLWKLGRRKSGGRVRRMASGAVDLPTPLPHFDRRSAVLRALGIPPLLYTGASSLPRRTEIGDRVHLYVDVSGSMGGVIGAAYGAIRDCREWVHPIVHLFSDRVSDATHGEIGKGVFRSTGGTDIACVARHMAGNRITRACVITDGWVGRPRGKHFRTLARAKLGVALIGAGVNPGDLSDVSDWTITLEHDGG